MKITYSRDEKLYYISHPFHRSGDWLSVDEHELPIPDEKKKGTFSGAVEVRKNDGRAYWRDVYPFSFYDIKSGRTEAIGEDTELFKDYASMSRWPEPRTPAFVTEAHRLIENHRKLQEYAQSTVDYHAKQIAGLEAEIAAASHTPGPDR